MNGDFEMTTLLAFARRAAFAAVAAILAIPGTCFSEVLLLQLPDESGQQTVGLVLDKDYSVSSIEVDLLGVPDSSVLESIALQHTEAFAPFFNLAPAHVNFVAPDLTSDLDYHAGLLVKWHFAQTTDLTDLSASIVGYPFGFVSTEGQQPPLEDNPRLVPEASSGLMLGLAMAALVLLGRRPVRSRAMRT